MKPVVFHKGDFYLRKEHDGSGGSSPIFGNDGSTEFYFHDLDNIKDILEKCEKTHSIAYTDDVKSGLEKIIGILIVMRYKLERVRIPESSYKMRDVEMCACYFDKK